MDRPALYYPYVHIRDDDWLKVAALFWPSIRRLVPPGYAKRDSPTAQTLVDAGILRDKNPGQLLDSMRWDLLGALQNNATELRRHYSISHAHEDRDGRRPTDGPTPPGASSELEWIHLTKFPPQLLDSLTTIGLARRGGPHGMAYHHGQPADAWIGLHPALAGAYMTALAGRISQQQHFQPLTDQDDLRVATPNSTVRAALRLLMGRQPSNQTVANQTAEGMRTYLMLAMQCARPQGLDGVSAEKIVQCREALAEELELFRKHVDQQRSKLTELAGLPDADRRLEAFSEQVQRTVELPLRRLENGLKLHKLEPTRSLVLTTSISPPILVGQFVGGAAATTAGAAAAVGTAWWQIQRQRQAEKASSPVSYLLDVRDHLTPRTLAARVRKVVLGTYSRHTD